MAYTLRTYQEKAVAAGLAFLRVPGPPKDGGHGLIVEPTGSGKSLVIANIVHHINRPCLVFQPSKEILEQNLIKLASYGYEPAVFSATVGSKVVGDRITLATIGSVADVPDLFEHVRHVLVDEADLVNPKTGMYADFLGRLAQARILGLTATPYRLSADGYGGSQLKFLTRTRPRVFGEVVHIDQTGPLMDAGFLARPDYQRVTGFDRNQIKHNTTGADFDDESLDRYYNKIGFADRLVRVVKRAQAVGRKRILVFTSRVSDAEACALETGGVVLTGKTPTKERRRIVEEFKSGAIQVVCNVGVLSVGFDYPELDTVVMARPTLSLRLYYQQIGRLVRPFPGKVPWLVDMVDNFSLFGRVEDMVIEPGGVSGEKWQVVSRPPGEKEKPLTNVYIGGKPPGGGMRNAQYKKRSPYWALPSGHRPWQQK